MARSPKVIGTQTETFALSRLVRHYDVVSIPFDENAPYDFIVERDGSLLRLQCKPGRIRNGVVVFASHASTVHHRTGERRDYRGRADLFVVHVPETDLVFLVPVDEVGRCDGFLRLEPTRNNQRQRVRYAADYLIGAELAQSGPEQVTCNDKTPVQIRHSALPTLFDPADQ